MKQSKFKKYVMWIRASVVALMMVLMSLLLFSFNKAQQATDDLWKQLGMSQQQGAEKIKRVFLNGYFDAWGAKNAKNIALGNRAAVANDLLIYTKEFMQGKPAEAAYQEYREQMKPRTTLVKSKTKEEIRKEKIDEMKKGVKSSEAMMKQFPDMEKDLKQSIEQLNGFIKDYSNPNSEMIELFYQSQQHQIKQEEDHHQEKLRKWMDQYPADHKQYIRKQLEKYLSIANTVDFSAQLMEKNKKQVFVKPAYEGKSSDWKMIFRAGKEVYQVAKPFAEQWMKEL